MTADKLRTGSPPDPGRELRRRAVRARCAEAVPTPRPLLRPGRRRHRAPRLGLRRRLDLRRAEPTHRYERDGAYTVTLHVTAPGRAGRGRVLAGHGGDARRRPHANRGAVARPRGRAGDGSRDSREPTSRPRSRRSSSSGNAGCANGSPPGRGRARSRPGGASRCRSPSRSTTRTPRSGTSPSARARRSSVRTTRRPTTTR